MDHLGLYHTLVAAVRGGSLSAAARARSITQPAVSQQISALERALGHSLIKRGRTGLSLTEAGQLAYDHALGMIEAEGQFRDRLGALNGQVSGQLRVTVNIFMSQTLMIPVLTSLRRDYPDLDVDLSVTDTLVDLAPAGLDLALRVGGLGRGSGFGRKVAEIAQSLVATPDYLARHGTPHHPDDLRGLTFIDYRGGRRMSHLSFSSGADSHTVALQGNLTVQTPTLILNTILAHMGYSAAPHFYIESHLASGALEPLLPGYRLKPKDIFIVRSRPGALSPRETAFLQALLRAFDATPGLSVTAAARHWVGLTGD